MTKNLHIKLLLLPALLVLCLACAPVTCSAQTVYKLTETELVQLENNLSRQQHIITQLLQEAASLKTSESESREQLQAALSELQQMKNELQLLRTDLKNSQNSLEQANQSLQAYEKEMKNKVSTIKRQRNLAVLAVAAVACLAK